MEPENQNQDIRKNTVFKDGKIELNSHIELLSCDDKFLPMQTFSKTGS